MNKEVIKQWIEALRSGKYKQGKRRLRRKESFCCLGVLCDLHSKETGNEWSDLDPVKNWSGLECSLYLGATAALPLLVEDWSGVEHELQEILYGMNDNGKSFEEIADYLEENYL